MSISPQATYLSTIIPNAVLPASVEVIEIDRSTSRARGNSANHGGSVRTVSKSSLASLDSSVSPSLSRRYDSDGSQTDNSNNPTPMPASVSGSNWSESQSSKTIVSHPSPISSKGSRKMCDSQSVGVNGAESQLKSGGGSLEDPTGVNTISTRSEPTSAESRVSGSGAAGEETKNKQNCTRSLSVMKTKQPPAPPQRTNSLHCNKIRNNVQINDNLSDSASHEAAPATSVEKDGPLLLTDEGKTRLRVLNSPGPTSPEAPSESGSPTQSSSDEAASAAEPLQEFNRVSPKKAPSEGGKFDRTMSPSSGYSSQSGTPTLSPKGVSQSSPDIEQRKPVKPERSMSRASSSAASPSSSLTSLSSATSDPLIQDVSTCCTSPVPQRSPTTSEPAPGLRGEVKELLNIPPPPRVRAPCPPPPETWVHNRRTFELLCGPCPHVPKVHKTTTQAEDGSTAGVKTDDREISPGLSERDTADKAMSESSPAKVPTLFATRPEDVRLGVERQDSPGTEQETLSEQDRKDTSADVQRRDETRGPVAEDPESTADQPPVTKTTLTIAHGEGWPLTGLSPETQQKETCRADVGDDVTVSDDTSEAEMDRSEVTLMQAFVIEPPKTTRISPPPTPPPAYHPTPPPSRRTPPSSVSVPPDELLGVLEEVHSAESCWPPPPPPLEGGSVFDGGEEMEFPPPPPPVMGDNGPDVDCCSTQVSVPNRPTAAVETVVESEKSSDAAETSPPRGPHLPPAAPPAEADKAEGVLQVSEDNTADVSCSPVQGSDGPPPPSADRADSPSLSAPLDSLTTPSPCDALISVPVAPPLPVDNPPAGVHFRRQPSVGHRDSRSKELLARHKSAPIPKEDAHIPLVTPSLLQMVRLRSVNMTDDPVKDDSEDKTTKDEAPGQNCPASSPGHQNTPQKPVRKSLSLKHPAQTGRTSGTPNTPSMRLQEAIRMKTAAMTSKEGLPCRLGMRSSICLSEPGILLKPPEAFDALKTPASTASFIFSRSSRKLVLETAAAPSPEPQARVKQNLATELMQLHDPSNAAAFCNGRLKSDRRPPPVARKPAPSSGNASHIPKMELSVDGTISVQPTRETTPPETSKISVVPSRSLLLCQSVISIISIQQRLAPLSLNENVASLIPDLGSFSVEFTSSP